MKRLGAKLGVSGTSNLRDHVEYEAEQGENETLAVPNQDKGDIPEMTPSLSTDVSMASQSHTIKMENSSSTVNANDLTDSSNNNDLALGKESQKSNKILHDFMRRVTIRVYSRLKAMQTKCNAEGMFKKDVMVQDVLNDIMALKSHYEIPYGEQWRLEGLIKERIRDTLNVLLATGALAEPNEPHPDGCDLQWICLPENSQRELLQSQRERSELEQTIKEKHTYLQELLVVPVLMETLTKRNREQFESAPESERISLPFVVVSTDDDAVIECDISENQSEIFLNLNKPFDIHDDSDVLKRMELSKADKSFVETIIPENLLPFVPSKVFINNEES